MCWLVIGGHFDAIGVDRTANVLALLLAERGEPRWNVGSDMIMNLLGKHNAPGLRDALEPGCDIDAVPVDVAILNDNVAEMYADAQPDAVPVSGARAEAKLALYIDCALQRSNNAREFEQRAVAHPFYRSPAVIGERRALNTCH